MTRLNQTKRRKIVENALDKAGVNSRKAALIERRKKLAYDIYLHALGGEKVLNQLEKDLKKFQAKLKIPELLEKHTHNNLYIRPTKDNEIYVAFGGRQINLQYNGYPNRSCEQEERISYKFWYSTGNNRQLFGADHPFSLEFDEIEKEAKAIDDIYTRTKLEVEAVVNSVTTINKLVQIWPEVVELLPIEEVTMGTALQVNVETLNTLLNLPSEKEEKGA